MEKAPTVLTALDVLVPWRPKADAQQKVARTIVEETIFMVASSLLAAKVRYSSTGRSGVVAVVSVLR